MKPFFPHFPLINKVFLQVPPAVLEIDDPSNFHDLLSFLEYVYIPFNTVFKVIELDVCKCQNNCATNLITFTMYI